MNTKTKLLRELDRKFPDNIFYSLPIDVQKYIRYAYQLVSICIYEKINENKKLLNDTTELRKQLNNIEEKEKKNDV